MSTRAPPSLRGHHGRDFPKRLTEKGVTPLPPLLTNSPLPRTEYFFAENGVFLGENWTWISKFYPFSLLLLFLFYVSNHFETFMKFYLAFDYLYENSFPIDLLFNKIINRCNVKLQQRYLEDIYDKLVHSMPITMQCGRKPQNNPTLTANKSGLKHSKLKNYHIIGIPRTSAFSWYTPFRSYIWNSPLNQPSKLKKVTFSRPKKSTNGSSI